MQRRRRSRSTSSRGWPTLFTVGVSVLAFASTMALVPSPAGAQTKGQPAVNRNPLPSDPVPVHVPQAPLGDLSNPPPNPAQLDKVAPKAKGAPFDPAKSKVLDDETTPTKKVFASPDGSRTAELSSGPVRFKDATGWHDIDLSLVPAVDGTLIAKSAPGTARLGARGDGSVATLDTPAGPIVLRHPDGRPAPAQLDRAGATYAGAVGGRDLALALNTSGLTETVTIGSPADGPTYRDEFILPQGVSARQAGDSVEFVDSAGAVVATFSPGLAHDANPKAGAMTPVVIRLAGVSDAAAGAGRTASVEVGVDKAWFAAPSRAFPLTIDPFLSPPANINSATAPSFDTWISGGAPTTSYAANPYLAVGTADGGATVNRALFWFDLSSIPAWSYVVTASLGVVNWYSGSGCTPTGVNLRGVATDAGTARPDANTVWNNRPASDTAAPTTASFAHIAPGTQCFPSARDSIDASGIARRWITNGEANHGLELRSASEIDSTQFKWLYSAESGSGVAPVLTITYDAVPTVAQPSSPADGAVLTTARPTLVVDKATDPEGDQVQYWFRASPAADGESGAHVVESGWITPGTPQQMGCPTNDANKVCYVVPDGELVDGVTYHWHVWTFDGIWWRYPDTWTWSFTTQLGLGDQPFQPNDQVGPAAVNLTNGNLTVHTSSPTYPTVGGGIGVSYTYNSAAPLSHGLVGEYYNVPAGTQPPSQTPVPADLAMIRIDPHVSHWWEGAPPAPGVGGDNFMVRWSGFITAPAGARQISAAAADGVRVTVGGNVLFQRWRDSTDADSDEANLFGGSYTFAAGVPVPIEILYYQHSGASAVALIERLPTENTHRIVGSDWLTPGSGGDLPPGWTLSVDTGAGPTPVSARPTEAGVSVTDASGAGHAFASNGSGYSPPPGEQGTLVAGAPGALTLQSGSSAFGFGADGAVTYASGGAAGSPATTACFVRSGSPSRLRAAVDPVSVQRMTFSYGGDAVLAVPAQPGCTSSATTTPVCPDPAAAVAGKLCAITYWDGRQTKFSYSGTTGAQPLLARIEDPGGAMTDFVYTAGRLQRVRSPLAFDVALGWDGTAGNASTVIHYDTNGRVDQVTAPADSEASANARNTAQPDTYWPRHSYAYDSATTTRVLVTGASEPSGWSRKVGFDSQGRLLADTDALARTTTTSWDGDDRMLTTTDPAGRVTAATYDASGRPVETYGPHASAPGACTGAGGASNGACPHTTTTYDGGIDGLAATFWPNATWSGLPGLLRTGVRADSGALDTTWSSSPVPGASGAWSARFTGEVTLASVGTYSFTAPGATVWVDDRSGSAGGSSTVSVTNAACPAGRTPVSDRCGAGSRHRITVALAAAGSGAAAIQLTWSGPGASGIVPGDKLSPGYGLVTSSVVEDQSAGSPSQVTTVAYGPRGAAPGQPDPATGLATSVRNGPAADAVTTTLTYEDTGWLRMNSRTLAAGNATTYTYYGGAETRTVPCPGGTTANQAGRLRTRTSPSPDGTAAGRVEEFVYDAAGRVAASKLATDTAWSCATYDQRDRVLTRTIAGTRTVTSTYGAASDGSGLETTMADATPGTVAVSAVVNVLGQLARYVDAWNSATSYTYDHVGRSTDVNGPGGQRHATYDAAGALKTQSLDGTAVVTDVGYDAFGETTSVTYGNGTALAVGRDGAGRTTSLSFTQRPPAGGGAAALLTSDVLGRSQAGRVLTDTLDGAGSPTSSFSYDAEGRLASAAVPGHTLTYAFAATNTCGTLAGAGRNTNRTSLTDVSGAGTATTAYCYGNDDRLTSASDPAVGTPGYDPHGNVTGIAGSVLTYDAADRHMSTTAAGTTVTYVRDATDRIISRTEAGTTVRYGYAGPGDSSAFTTEPLLGLVNERTMGLAGGVLLTKRGSGDVWSYPNVHGDLVATADANGAKQGATLAYDPDGKALSSPSAPDNSPGNFDYGWLGSAQRPLEHAGSQAIVEMGARLYLPAVGRFLQVDPVEGGSCNDYDYVCGDPVNGIDLDGRCGLGNPFKRCGPGHEGGTNILSGAIYRGSDGARALAKYLKDNPWKVAGYAVAITCVAFSAGVCATAVIGLTAAKVGATAQEHRGDFLSRAHVGDQVWNLFTAWALAIPGMAAAGAESPIAFKVLMGGADFVCGSFSDCATPGYPG
jgi:RHS repeat-associated protein